MTAEQAAIILLQCICPLLAQSRHCETEFQCRDLVSGRCARRPAISKHLRLLRRVGLVVTKNEGTTRICQLNAEPLRVVDAWLRDYEEFWAKSLQSLKRYVEEDR